MKNFLKEYAWAIYLGGALAMNQIGANTWQYYAIFIPLVILVDIKSQKNENK